MRTSVQLILTLSIAGLIMGSCSKDEDEIPVPLTKTQMLVGTWDKIGYTVSPPIPVGGGTLITDLFAQWEPCKQDDTETFNADKSYTLEEGISKCYPGSNQVIIVATWGFNSDETLLVITHVGGGGHDEASIEVLDGVTMRLNAYHDLNGIIHTYTSFYIKR